LTLGFSPRTLAAPVQAPAVKPVLPALGALELAVLEDLWQAGDVDAKDVHRRVGASRGISLNTVQSTLERLFRKGLLRRDKVSHAYRYRAQVDRTALVGLLIEATVGRVAGAETGVLMSAFVDIASRAGDAQLDQLEALIATARAARDAGAS
jgi:predicted transcriptional regulator